jgi:hypothetical protein
MKFLEGLPARNKNIFYLAMGYTVVVELVAWSVSREQSQKKKQEFIEYYRYAGHYKHPWAEDPTPVPEHVKSTDYAKMIENPQGLRYYGLGHRI